jgi:signal transduction histidine kinase/ActR/RegA family two-component response regulator
MRGPPGTGPEYVRLRPYLLLIVLVVVPILALASVAYLLSSRAVDRLVRSGNDATVTMTASFLEREFKQWTSHAASYARFPTLSGEVTAGDVDEVRRRLAIIVDQNDLLDRAFVTDLTGLLWADFPEAPESLGRRFDERDWFRGVSGSRRTYVSELYQRHAEPPVPVVAVASPVRDPETDEVSGFLVLQVLPDGIADLLRAMGDGEERSAILLDHRGVVVAHPTLDLRGTVHLDYAALLPSISRPAGEVRRLEYQDPLSGGVMIASVMTARVGDHRWTVLAQMPETAALAPTRALAFQLAAGGILLTILIGGLATGLVRENDRRADAERSLAAMNRELEKRVHERTEDLRKTEEQLFLSRRLESVGRLAGGIAHDFNNLLTVIIGTGRLLRDSLPEGSPEREDLDDLTMAGERAADLTRQLLAFSRKQVMKPEIMDVNRAVERLRGILERVIGEDVDLVFSLGADPHPVKFDPGQIEQVVINLAVNARDAMPKGGKLTIQTGNVDLDEEYAREHPGARAGPHVMLAVTDTGRGMDVETRERIFEPFFTTKGMGRGTGLGLATVYGIVKQGGGNIWVYSEPGRGTTFKIYLPRTDEVPLGVEEATAGPEGPDRGTILVVEDSEGVRSLVVRVLRTAGFTVHEAEDAAGGAEMFHATGVPFDLLLTDVVLPDRSGPEMARELEGDQPGLKVLYMSGYTDDSIVHHGILDPGTEFIEKPMTPDNLLRKVREVMGKKRA